MALKHSPSISGLQVSASADAYSEPSYSEAAISSTAAYEMGRAL